MTEQIKDSMETCRIIVHATVEELSNQRRYNDAKEIEVAVNDMLKAFRSLQAWEEVLAELKEERDFFTSIRGEYARGRVFANSKAIDIVSQHLAEIEG